MADNDAKRIIQAIIGLENNNNFMLIIQQLYKRKDGYERGLARTKDATELRWLQGRMQELTDLLEGVDKARSYLESMEAGQKIAHDVAPLFDGNP